MSRSSRPDRVALTGADCFLRAFDDEIRHVNGASHVSQLVLRLGPGFDPDRFERELERAARAQPMLRARIHRPLGLAAPVYDLRQAERAPLPEVRVHHCAGPRDEGRVPEACFARMNERFRPDRGELLRFDVFLYDAGERGTDLVMSWLHMLFDGGGSEAFLEWLQAVGEGERDPADAPAAAGDLPLVKGKPVGARDRGQRAMAWQRHLETISSEPIRSLAGPRARVRQDLCYDLHTLDADASALATGRATERAGFLTPMLFYLAAAVRAHDAVFRARGVDPGGFLVPLPVNLRPKGADPALFRTHVSLLWFRVGREAAGDFDALLDELKRQRREGIRAQLVENGVFAMDYARYAPMRVYAHMARRRLRGELCSFFFAYTGEFAGGIDRFFGAEIEHGFHAAPVPPSPGSSAAFSLRRDRLHLTHVHQRGVISAEEREVFWQSLRTDLVGPG